MTYDLLIIILFLMFNLALGIVASKNIKTIEHFSVGHRSFSTFAIFATLSASFIGGGYTLGNAAKVYAFALLGFSLKEILVATIIAPRMDVHNDCLSIGDIIEKRYGRIPKIVTGIFAVIVCTGILGAQVGAMGAIFNRFFDLSPFWGIIIGFGVIIFYATLGGMRGVVYTDILQFIILIIAIPSAFFVTLYHIGGWQQLIIKIPERHLYFLQDSRDIIFFIGLFITFIFGETLVPPYVQRLFMAKTSRETRNATLASGLLSIPFFLLVGAIGLLAFWLDPTLDPNMALPYIVQTQLSIVLRGFVIAGILSVIMSSAAGFLNAAAVAFVNDIVRPITNDQVSRHTLLKLAKGSTLFVGIGSVVFALAINNVLDILLYAYNFWSPIILVPLIAALIGIKASTRDFLVGALSGGLAMAIWTWYLQEPYHLNGVIVGIMTNLALFTLSYQFSRFKITLLDSIKE